MEILIPISIGELYDRLTILEIKENFINDAEKLKNIRKEQNILSEILLKQQRVDKELYLKMKSINLELWMIEDKIRVKEKNKQFDQEFIELARNVYYKNDERSKIKREINLKYNSDIIEEKQYEKYD